MSRAPLDYETPRPTDAAKRKYGRYATAAFLIGVAVGFLLAFAIKWALVAGTVHHIGWISRLGPSSRTLIGTAALCAPILIAACSIHRVQKKLLGAELAAKAAEERRLLEEEMAAAVWWKVPKSADAAEWPKVLLITGASYTATFVLVLAFIPLGLLLDWLPPQGGAHDDMSALHVAFYSANVLGTIVPTLFILLLVLPRARVTLISHGVVHRGPTKTLIPYSSIREVRIAPSRRRRSLKCVAILATDERVGERWHRYELGPDAPIGPIVKAFESKGFSVAVDVSADPTNEPAGGEIRS